MQSEQTLRQQADAVNHKSMKELNEQFQELYGFSCGETSPRNLRKRIIYRLQEIYYGGIDRVDMEILNDIADKDPIANLKTGSAKHASRVAGTKLYRIWKGKQYEVLIGKNGKFIFNGEVFKSLSAVANRITGTKWNGKAFFGVKG